MSRLAATVAFAMAACLLAACTKSSSASPDAGDAGGDVGSTGDGDLPDARLDLTLDIDCPECGGSCGDGMLRAGEQCDDGNRNPGDGCSAICQIVPGWTCPVPGMPCLYLPPNPDASP